MLAQPAIAGAIFVPTEMVNLQRAIDSATRGDTVFVEPGTYTGAGNKNLNFRGKDIVVWGIEGARATIIDCEGSELEPARGFVFESGEPHTAVVSGLTIKNGHRIGNLWPDAIGGGMLIANEGTRPTIKNCIFQYNHANKLGGGIAIIDGAAPAVASCTLFRNTGRTGGGGVVVSNADPTIVECEFTGNDSFAGDGGGLKCAGTSGTRIRDSVFHDNSALAGGALMVTDPHTIMVAQCTFVDNTATRFSGGGICVQGGAELRLANGVLARNSAVDEGGGIACNTGTITLNRCTFHKNTAPAGSGIRVADGGIADVENTIIAFGVGGAGLACTGSGEATLACSDVHGNEGGDWTSCIEDQAGMNGNMATDPLFCNAGHGNLYLAETSPCASEHAGACGQIGRYGVDCVTAVAQTSWGAIKAHYRR
jgi:hypothetical protein